MLSFPGKVFQALCALLILTPFVLFAQYVPGVNNNMVKLAQVHNYRTYSNLWGYVDTAGHEYALIGHNAGTSIIDVTNPSSPREVVMIPGPTSTGTIWREIKTWGKYAYVVSEHSSPTTLSGIQIIDLSRLPDTAKLVKNYRWPGVDSTNARAHTVCIDSAGYLYINGGTATRGSANSGGIRIFSLADPVNPQPVGLFGPRYVHDSFFRGGWIFASNINDSPGHLDVINAKNRANPTLSVSFVYPNGFSHNSWITADNKYLLQTDEQSSLTVKIFDVSKVFDADSNNNDQITLVGQYLSSAGSVAHEPRIVGDYVYISHYAEGVRIIDMSNPASPAEVGYYDTYPGGSTGFNGCWGVWPYLPSGTVLASDITTGLYIFSAQPKKAATINGTIKDLQTGAALTGVTVKFVEASKSPAVSNNTFTFRTNEGTHRVVLTKSGYTTDTVSVILSSANPLNKDFFMNSNLVRSTVTADSVNASLRQDSSITFKIVVKNSGSAGRLDYLVNAVPLTPGSEITWMSFSRTSGALQPNAVDTVTVTLRGAGLQAAVYNAGITIVTNDPTKKLYYLTAKLTVTAPTGIDDNLMPTGLVLHQNYPNPFNPETVVKFGLPENSDVTVNLYDITGRLVRSLMQGFYTAGYHSLSVNASDLAGGVYILRLQTGNSSKQIKMTVLK